MSVKKLNEYVKKYGTPIKVQNANDIINSINEVIEIFKCCQTKYNYKGEYQYFYAMKANAYAESVLIALKHCSGLECASLNELMIIDFLINNNLITSDKTIIINGFKQKEHFIYANKFIDHVNVVFNIDNMEELQYIDALNKKIQIGIRISDDRNSRFGLSKNDIKRIIIILKERGLSITTLQFSMRNFISEKAFFNKIVENLYTYKLIKEYHKSLCNIDISGFSFNNKLVDVKKFTKKLLTSIICFCESLNIAVPNIFHEIGDKTVSKSECIIYKVIQIKKNLNKIWYILDGSIICDIPDYWSHIMDELKISILNGVKKGELIKVNLGGVSCDECDSVANVMLQKPDKNKDIFVCIENIGGYQDMLQSKCIRHCLVKDTRKLFVAPNGENYLFKDQNFDFLNSLHYNDEFIKFLFKFN